MLRILDIMSDEVFSVAASALLEEAAWELAAHDQRGAPVRDERGRLVGTVTTAHLVDPERGAWSRRGRAGRARVADVMSPEVVVMRADEPAFEAVRILAREEAEQILVVDDLDRVVGVVTAMDVLRALVHGDRLDEHEAPPHAGNSPPDPRH
jgi:CBS-domain-containing membrane protein